MKERDMKLLEAVINYHIQSGESVASRTIEKKYEFGVSSATIRNIMSDLEDEGFLKKTHTSSGRIPTVEGYRLYLKELEKKEVKNFRDEIIKSFFWENLDVENIFKTVASCLSDLTSNVAFVLEHSANGEEISNVKLVYINNKEAFVNIVINNKFVKTSNLTFKTLITEEVLQYLNNKLDTVMKEVGNIQINELISYLETVGTLSNDISGTSYILNNELHTKGELNLLEKKDVSLETSLNIIKNLINDKQKVSEIIESEDVEFEKNYVRFGLDIEDDLKDISIIHKSFLINNRKLSIGVITPIRADYETIFSYLDSVRDICEYIINKNNTRKLLN